MHALLVLTGAGPQAGYHCLVVAVAVDEPVAPHWPPGRCRQNDGQHFFNSNWKCCCALYLEPGPIPRSTAPRARCIGGHIDCFPLKGRWEKRNPIPLCSRSIIWRRNDRPDLTNLQVWLRSQMRDSSSFHRHALQSPPLC